MILLNGIIQKYVQRLSSRSTCVLKALIGQEAKKEDIQIPIEKCNQEMLDSCRNCNEKEVSAALEELKLAIKDIEKMLREC